MAKDRIPSKNVKIAAFAKEELDLLVERLSNDRPDLNVTDGALMSAIIIGAQAFPNEALAAVLTTYWSRDQEAAAVAAVCDFLQAHAR